MRVSTDCPNVSQLVATAWTERLLPGSGHRFSVQYRDHSRQRPGMDTTDITVLYVRSEVHQDDVRRLIHRYVDAKTQLEAQNPDAGGADVDTDDWYRVEHTDATLCDLLAARRQVRQGLTCTCTGRRDRRFSAQYHSAIQFVVTSTGTQRSKRTKNEKEGKRH
jgi:hypothetical protein